MNSKKLIRSTLPLLVLALAGLFASGCAQIMCIKQPSPFKPASLVTGAKRVDIVAELGPPVTSEQHSNLLTDAYSYVDGGGKNNGLCKTGRVIIYTGGDMFTLWLDQIIWMPMEHFGFAGTDHSVMVDYARANDGFWHATSFDDKAMKGRSTKKEEF